MQKGRDQGASYDTLLPISKVSESIEQKMKEAAKLREEERRKQEGKCNDYVMCISSYD